MINKIRAYLDHEFEGAPNTKKIMELKEELFANLIEKYNDKLAKGASEEDAYKEVIAGLGDVSGMINDLNETDSRNVGFKTEEARRKSALLTAVAVGLFIMSTIAMLILGEVFHQEILGVTIMFSMIALGVGLLIYNNMTKPKYIKEEDTIVEEFKEWRVDNSNRKDHYKSLKSAYWLIVTAVYLFVSFVTFRWEVTWLIWIIATALEKITMALISIKEDV